MKRDTLSASFRQVDMGRAARRGILQRKCACGQHTGGGAECSECQGKRTSLQRSAAGDCAVLDRWGGGRCPQGIDHDEGSTLQRRAHDPSVVPPIVHDVLRSPGQPLDSGTRAFMEPRFGHDFSHVRVHTDSRAAESAEAVDALAYTAGIDMVFGQGQYRPQTADGRRLLTHELTHVLQQGGALPSWLEVGDPGSPAEVEADRFAAEAARSGYPAPRVSGPLPAANRKMASQRTARGSGSVLQRQIVPPAAQGGPPPPAPGWVACPANETGQLNGELSAAVSWTTQAVNDLAAANWPARTRGALGRYLSADPNHVAKTILPNLRSILVDLQLGPTHFRCQTQAQCLQAYPTGAVAYAGHPITLCPPYFGKALTGRVTTLIHEAGHNAGLAGNVVEWQRPFPGLSISTRLGNTESYAAFVRNNQFPEIAPYQQQLGFGLGTGTLVPVGGSPRFLVTAELDLVLARRIFYFWDLHAGLRVDVDSTGSVLGSLTAGARLFTPSSLSRVPFFLDLRAGGVGGQLLGVTPPGTLSGLLLGPSGEVRSGVQTGNIGASIGYRYVLNLLENYPDIHELTIGGEVRF